MQRKRLKTRNDPEHKMLHFMGKRENLGRRQKYDLWVIKQEALQILLVVTKKAEAGEKQKSVNPSIE